MIMKFSKEIPLKFLDYQKKIKSSLAAKGISQAHVYRSIGMSQNTWIRRIRNNSFTASEVLQICEVVNK